MVSEERTLIGVHKGAWLFNYSDYLLLCLARLTLSAVIGVACLSQKCCQALLSLHADYTIPNGEAPYPIQLDSALLSWTPARHRFFQLWLCFVSSPLKEEPSGPKSSKSGIKILSALSLYGQVSFSWKSYNQKHLSTISDYDAGRNCWMYCAFYWWLWS